VDKLGGGFPQRGRGRRLDAVARHHAAADRARHPARRYDLVVKLESESAGPETVRLAGGVCRAAGGAPGQFPCDHGEGGGLPGRQSPRDRRQLLDRHRPEDEADVGRLGRP
jgi:hypothetical protein